MIGNRIKLHPTACDPTTELGPWTRFVLGLRVLVCAGILICGCSNESFEPSIIELRGAGSAFPAPLYERWFSDMTEQYPELAIDYEMIGSGAGVQQFVDELVDFAASDDPLTDREIAQVDRGVRQVPMTSGAIVLAYNLRDANKSPINNLRLSRKAYAGIFLGQIRSWLDEEITRHNPDVSFPDLPIQVEYRLDSSGTTSALTRHLSQISQDWKVGPGIGKTVIFPVGAGMPKNRGVARGLKQVPGSIGYLSYAFAKQEKLSMAILENRAGQFVAPDLDSIQIGLHGSGVSISAVRDFVTDPKGDGAYPIVTYSWLLCYHVYDDPAKLAMLQELISYGLQDGQQYSGELGYVALLEEVSRSALTVSKSITLPQNADTATSIPVSEIEHLPPDTSGAVIDEVVEEETDVMPTGTETSREASADVQSDGVVVEEAVTEAKATNAAGIEKQQAERGEDGNDQTSAPTDQPPPAP